MEGSGAGVLLAIRYVASVGRYGLIVRLMGLIGRRLQNFPASERHSHEDESMNETTLLSRVTMESGLQCCQFADLQTAAQELLGYPIWTHEFGISELWLELKLALVLKDLGFVYPCKRWVDPATTFRRFAPDTPVIEREVGPR